MSTSKKKNKINKPERRYYKRRTVLETFHVFMCIQQRGLAKIYLKDVSENGFAFTIEDIEGFKKNQKFQCLFFINAGLAIPLKFRVAHISQQKNSEYMIGVQLQKCDAKAKRAYSTFVKLLDVLSDVSKVYETIL